MLLFYSLNKRNPAFALYLSLIKYVNNQNYTLIAPSKPAKDCKRPYIQVVFKNCKVN